MEFEGANIGSILQKETILFNLYLVLPEKILNPKKISNSHQRLQSLYQMQSFTIV